MSSRPRDRGKRGDVGISRLIECTRLVAERVCEGNGFRRLLCRVLSELARCLELGMTLACYALLKLAVETAVQHAYYSLQGVAFEEALPLIRRRSRAAASFTATMVRRLKGVHGPRKAWVLKTYLRVAEYVHPSARLHEAGGEPGVDEALFLGALDVVTYLELLAGVHIDAEVARRCGLEKTLKTVLRRGS